MTEAMNPGTDASATAGAPISQDAGTQVAPATQVQQGPGPVPYERFQEVAKQHRKQEQEALQWRTRYEQLEKAQQAHQERRPLISFDDPPEADNVPVWARQTAQQVEELHNWRKAQEETSGKRDKALSDWIMRQEMQQIQSKHPNMPTKLLRMALASGIPLEEAVADWQGWAQPAAPTAPVGQQSAAPTKTTPPVVPAPGSAVGPGSKPPDGKLSLKDLKRRVKDRARAAMMEAGFLGT